MPDILKTSECNNILKVGADLYMQVIEFLHNEEKGKSSNIKVPLSPAFLEETVQFGIQCDINGIRRIILILDHSTNGVYMCIKIIIFPTIIFIWTILSELLLASIPGRLLGEGRPGIDCLHMRRVFRILSSKLDRKQNHPRMARTILRSKVNIHGTIIRRVYGEYMTTRGLG